MRGSVMKRGSTWTYVMYLGRDASGRKQQKWVGGHRTRREAEDAMVEALERMRTGMWVDPGTMTLGAYLREWLSAMETSVQDTTYRAYEQSIRNWVMPRLSEVPLKELSPMDQAKRAGELLAERAKAAGVETCVFDRGGYRYHGRVKALADGAREGGLTF